MATVHPTLSPDVFESLSELYLSLWKALDQVEGENKWFDITTFSTDGLIQRAEEQARKLKRVGFSEGVLPRQIERDISKTRDWISLSLPSIPEQPGERRRFLAYLLDRGLRYRESHPDSVS
ncbi:MAG TPA: hypothetical protein VML01_07785 [Bryobacterales bacterium]|nr:hypothetical protein [Bryobacterales bacterium]